MKLLIEPSRELPLVQLAVSFPHGGVDDPPARLGLARVVGRMLRRGCAGLGPEALEERLDAIGADLGVHVGLGATTLSCEVLARSVEPMVELVATMLAEPCFSPVELGKLRRQTEAEIVSSRDDDGILAGRALQRHLWAGHLHARRVQGTVATVRTIEREDVVAFHHRAYCRTGAIVGFAGDLDAGLAETLAGRLLLRLPDGEAHRYPAGELGLGAGRRLVVVDKPERTQTRLGIGALGTHARDEDHTALLVANTAFGGTFSSRLVQQVRAKRGWSYGASSQLVSGRIREAFTMWTAPAAGDTCACLGLELDLLEQWHAAGIEQGELDLAKDYLCRSYAFEIDTAKKRLHQQLDRALLALPDDYHGRFCERVRSVTLAEANAAVRRRIDPGRLWVAAVATDDAIGAALRSLLDWTEAVVEAHDLE